MRACAGSQFDPMVVAAFERVIRDRKAAERATARQPAEPGL